VASPLNDARVHLGLAQARHFFELLWFAAGFFAAQLGFQQWKISETAAESDDKQKRNIPSWGCVEAAPPIAKVRSE
jgi:hypothetical protein